MECEVCLEVFSRDKLRPKVLQCGHTFCLRCLKDIEGFNSPRQCPICRKAYSLSADATPDNYMVLTMVDQRAAGDGAAAAVAARRLWCADCAALAGPDCGTKRGHTVLGPKAALWQQLKGAVPRFCQHPDGLEGCGEEEVLSALAVLSGPSPATCSVTLQKDGGAAYSAQCTLGPSDLHQDPVLKALVGILALRAGLKQVPTKEEEAHREEEKPEPIAHLRVPASVCLAGPGEKPESKAELLECVRQRGVRRLEGVSCQRDSAWSLELLRAASPSVEELEVTHPSAEHLAAVHAMPLLRRLAVAGDDKLYAEPVALPEVLPGGRGSRLRTLRLTDGWTLPRETLQAVLRAHGPALRALELRVGTPGDREWPWCCGNLQATLARCGLSGLQRLLLVRGAAGSSAGVGRNVAWHWEAACKAQMDAVRRVLPTTAVLCATCDEVDLEDF